MAINQLADSGRQQKKKTLTRSVMKLGHKAYLSNGASRFVYNSESIW